jgi:hypothetical protein
VLRADAESSELPARLAIVIRYSCCSWERVFGVAKGAIDSVCLRQAEERRAIINMRVIFFIGLGSIDSIVEGEVILQKLMGCHLKKS